MDMKFNGKRAFLVFLPVIFCFAFLGADQATNAQRLTAGLLAPVENETTGAPLQAAYMESDMRIWHLPDPVTDAGSLVGLVQDAETGDVLEGVTADLILGSEIIETQTSDSNGKYGFADITDDEYQIDLSYDGYITTNMWTGVVMDIESQLPNAPIVMHPVILHGDISGKITDALTGNPLRDVAIKLRWGINPPTSRPILYSATTGQGGNYSISDVKAGVYTIFASKDGYRDGSFTGKSIGAQATPNQDGFLSPTIEGDELRIVLTWGQFPLDLDSHLWAPHNGCEAANPFHLFYPDAEDYGGQGCSSYFSLDLDDTSSFGPETTTIWQWYSGRYWFLVHDYSNHTSCNPAWGPCKAMSNSGATVTVLTATDTYVFNITRNVSATAWRVV